MADANLLNKKGRKAIVIYIPQMYRYIENIIRASILGEFVQISPILLSLSCRDHPRVLARPQRPCEKKTRHSLYKIVHS